MAPAPLSTTLEALSADLAGEWEALADRVAGAPFLRAGWVQAWWRAFGRGSLSVWCVRRGSELAAVLPVRTRGGRVTATANDHTPVFGPLAEPGDPLTELGATVFAASFRSVTLPLLRPGAQIDALEAAAVAAGRRTLRREQGRLPLVTFDGASPYERLPSGRRADLRRCRRRLDELGRVTLQQTTTEANLDAALNDLVALEAMGWKGERRVAVASRPTTAAFYREVAGWAAHEGMLRLYVLRVDERPVAATLGLAAHGELYLLKAGFDPALARCSPGRLLLAEVLADAAASGLRCAHLLGRPEAYKVEWADDFEQRCTLQAFDRSGMGTVEWSAFAWGRPLLRAAGVSRPDAQRKHSHSSRRG
jgi:CelD/BcsL family acetyltransferase involved in cellulose biosynthesis